MPKFPKPWYRKTRGLWYVTLHGKQHNLGPDKDAAFAQYHALMQQPAPQKASAGSVAALFDAFLDWTQKNREERTYEFYRERLQSFLKHFDGHQPVTVLKPFHVQAWIDSLSGSDGHKRGCVTTVKRSMNWAAKMGHIDKSPVASLEKPEGGRREFIILPELYKKVLAHSHGQNFHDLVTVAWETGARPQELFAVEKRHFDPKGQRWVFPKQESKGKKRPRVVYLTDESFAICERLTLQHPTGCLFRNAKGDRWHRNNVNCRFDRMKKKIGVKLCLYNFRHTFATRLLEADVDPMVVATLLGHKDLSMLGRTYAHLSQNADHLRANLKRTA